MTLLLGLSCTLPSLTMAQQADAETGWQLASPTTLAETLGDGLRVREGYRYQDPPSVEDPRAPASDAGEPAGRSSLPVPQDSDAAGESRNRASAWVNALGVELIGDRDGDGYYRAFRLDIDVDTTARGTDVFAIIYLQRSGQFPQTLHTTRNFFITGSSRADEYTLEIELLDDYRAGQYDLAIDIVDAYDGRLLDAVSAFEFRSLGGLPLEAPDGGFDDCFYGDYNCSSGFHDDDPHNGEYVGVAYAGGTGGGMLLALSLLVLHRRFRPYTLEACRRASPRRRRRREESHAGLSGYLRQVARIT